MTERMNQVAGPIYHAGDWKERCDIHALYGHRFRLLPQCSFVSVSHCDGVSFHFLSTVRRLVVSSHTIGQHKAFVDSAPMFS